MLLNERLKNQFACNLEFAIVNRRPSFLLLSDADIFMRVASFTLSPSS